MSSRCCYKLITYDTYGDGWNNNGTFGVTNQFGTELVPTTVMGPMLVMMKMEWVTHIHNN